MKSVLFFTLLCCSLGSLLAQSSQKKTNLVAGTSVTYLPLSEQRVALTGTQEEVLHHAIPWQLTFGFEFHPSYRLSLDNKLYLYKSVGDSWKTANLIGLTHQLDFLSLFRESTPIDVNFGLSRLFVEASTHVGDFCFCEGGFYTLPAPKVYLGFGVGFGIRLSPKIDLDFAAMAVYMLAPPNEYLPHFNYVVGIDYYFRPRNKKVD